MSMTDERSALHDTVDRAWQVGVAEHLNRLGLRGKLSKEQEADAARLGEAAVRSERALGQVILTAGYNGEIKVFENLGAPHWLHSS